MLFTETREKQWGCESLNKDFSSQEIKLKVTWMIRKSYVKKSSAKNIKSDLLTLTFPCTKKNSRL